LTSKASKHDWIDFIVVLNVGVITPHVVIRYISWTDNVVCCELLLNRVKLAVVFNVFRIYNTP
jgi:hypothetical protein